MSYKIRVAAIRNQQIYINNTWCMHDKQKDTCLEVEDDEV